MSPAQGTRRSACHGTRSRDEAGLRADAVSRCHEKLGRLSGALLLATQETFIEYLLGVSSVQSTEDALGNQEAKPRAYRRVTDEKQPGDR